MEYTDLPEIPVYGFAPDAGGLIGLFITMVLPLLVALLAKQSWGVGTKGLLLLGLAAIKSALEAYLMSMNKGVDLDLIPVIYSTLINFMIAVAVHFGLLKGTGLQRKASNSGNVDGSGTDYRRGTANPPDPGLPSVP